MPGSLRPENIFLFFSLIVGLVLCVLIPPLGGGNEVYNFERAVTFAYGHPLVEEAQLPAGVRAFIDTGNEFFHEGLQPPFHFPRELYEKMATIPLAPGELAPIVPSASVHHPFCYVPQALFIKIGAMFAATPLELFLLARMGGLFFAVVITYFAIRIVPSHRYLLCGLALLPPITFSRSTVDADTLTNAMGFLFIAWMLHVISGNSRMRTHSLLFTAALAFVMAQCKNVYLFLPLLALALPESRFSSNASRRFWQAAIILPGIAGSIGWMMLVKHMNFSGHAFHTWGGEVNSDQQLALMLQHPLTYVATFLRTIFLTSFFLESVRELIGVFGPPVSLPMPSYLAIFGLLFLTFLADATATSASYPKGSRWLSLIIVILFIGLSQTILYLNWTGVGLPEIKGFQGRYFYPLLPLLIVFAKPPEKPLPVSAGIGLTAFAATGLALMLRTTATVYFG